MQLPLPLEPETVLILLEQIGPAHMSRIAFSDSVDWEHLQTFNLSDRRIELSRLSPGGVSLEKCDALFLASHDLPQELKELVSFFHSLRPGGIALLELAPEQKLKPTQISSFVSEIGLRVIFDGPVREIPGLNNPDIGAHARTPLMVLERQIPGGKIFENTLTSILLIEPDQEAALENWSSFILHDDLIDKIEVVYLHSNAEIFNPEKKIKIQAVEISRNVRPGQAMQNAIAFAESRYMLWCEHPEWTPPDSFYSLLLAAHKMEPATEFPFLLKVNLAGSARRSGQRIPSRAGQLYWWNRRTARLLFEMLSKQKNRTRQGIAWKRLIARVHKHRGVYAEVTLRSIPEDDT